MNERIKELAEKAGFVLWGNEEWGPGEGRVDWSCDYEDALTKYTELIVRECADIATMNQFQWDSAGGYVLKHFGVEE